MLLLIPIWHTEKDAMKIGPESPLIREQFDSLTRNQKYLLLDTLGFLICELLNAAGIQQVEHLA